MSAIDDLLRQARLHRPCGEAQAEEADQEKNKDPTKDRTGRVIVVLSSCIKRGGTLASASD